MVTRQAVKIGMGLYEYRGHILEKILKDGRPIWKIRCPYANHPDKINEDNLFYKPTFATAKEYVDTLIERWYLS